MNRSFKNFHFSTYIGGTSHDSVKDIILDNEDNIYLTGSSMGPFPMTNSYQSTPSGWPYNAIALKMDNTGSSLLFSTYINGNLKSQGRSINIDYNGNPVILGRTTSSNFPITGNRYQNTILGKEEIFISRLNSLGTNLEYSTFFGGSQSDTILDSVVDKFGFIYFTGFTDSTDFPSTTNAYDPNPNGNSDIFCSKIFIDDFHPLNLSGNPEYFRVNLTWDPPSRNIFDRFEFVNYSIFRGTNETNPVLLAKVGNQTFYLDDDPAFHSFNETNYYYYVTSTFKTIGESYNSSIVHSSQKIPLPPSNLGIVSGYFSLNLTWSLLNTSFTERYPIDEFRIYKGESSDDLQLSGVTSDYYYFDNSDSLVSFFNKEFFYALTYTLLGIDGNSSMSDYISGTPLVPNSAPTIVEIEPGDLQMNVSWDPPSGFLLENFDIEKYLIYRGEESSFNMHYEGETVGKTHYIDNNLTTEKIRYFYSVSAVFETLGEGDRSELDSSESLTIPGQPMNARISHGDEYLNISWSMPLYDGGSNVISYRIYRGMENNDLSFIDDVDVMKTFFNDSGLENGKRYYYLVTAVNGIGESIEGAKSSGIPKWKPTPPLDIKASSGDEFIQVSWTPPADHKGPEITSYKVYREGNDDEWDFINEIDFDTLSYNDTDVFNGVEYQYYVVAVNGEGVSERSDIVSAIPMTVPEGPGNMNLNPGNKFIIISWELPTIDGGSPFLGQRLYKRDIDDNDFFFIQIDNGISGYNDTDVTNGVEYQYFVVVYNVVGESEETEILSTIPFGPSTPPTNFRVDEMLDHLELSWDKPTFNGGREITGYDIYRDGEKIGRVGSNIQSYKDYLSNDFEIHSYYLIAINPGGISDGTEILQASMTLIDIGTEPTLPRSLNGRISENTIIINWVEPENNGGTTIERYMVYRKTLETDWSLIGEISPLTLEFEDDDIAKGTTYSYRVTCENEVGESEPSDELMIEYSENKASSSFVLIVIIAIVFIILIAVTVTIVIMKKRSEAEIVNSIPDQPVQTPPDQIGPSLEN
jgi:fibronectin type III domain protein/beta-propeller repeat-containing protein